MKDNHFLYPIHPNYRYAIISKTLKGANELFEKMNVFDRKFFVKDTLHHKVLYNGAKFILSGSTNAACNTKGCSLAALIIDNDIPKQHLDMIYTCIYPVMASCNGAILRYDEEMGLVKYVHEVR